MYWYYLVLATRGCSYLSAGIFNIYLSIYLSLSLYIYIVTYLTTPGLEELATHLYNSSMLIIKKEKEKKKQKQKRKDISNKEKIIYTVYNWFGQPKLGFAISIHYVWWHCHICPFPSKKLILPELLFLGFHLMFLSLLRVHLI